MDRGDCLYIPYGWYHSVKSHPGPDRKNHALNLWWEMEKSPRERTKVAECPDPGTGKQTTLASKITFSRDQWPEPPQKGGQGGGGGEDEQDKGGDQEDGGDGDDL